MESAKFIKTLVRVMILNDYVSGIAMVYLNFVMRCWLWTLSLLAFRYCRLALKITADIDLSR